MSFSVPLGLPSRILPERQHEDIPTPVDMMEMSGLCRRDEESE